MLLLFLQWKSPRLDEQHPAKRRFKRKLSAMLQTQDRTRNWMNIRPEAEPLSAHDRHD